MEKFIPKYIQTYNKAKLEDKIKDAYSLLVECCLCPHNCGNNRMAGEKGICNTGRYAMVSSFSAHFGEEEQLVGYHGSGTIFFTNCNLLCNFCQNYDISHQGYGTAVTDNELADIMLHLQKIGCHNINFVTPTHVVPQILSALKIAVQKGLSIPLVYNSGGYDKIQSLKILDGIIDIYMPDFKFWNNSIAEKTCGISDYREIVCKAIKEMYMQTGNLKTDNKNIAESGLIVRHLVLPQGMAGTEEIMKFIGKELSRGTFVNIMSQYRPCGDAKNLDGFNRRINDKEYMDALKASENELKIPGNTGDLI